MYSDKERFKTNKYLLIVPYLGIVAGIIGFIIHIKNAYTFGIPKMSNDYIGVWFASYSILIASISVFMIQRPGRFSPISLHKSIWILVFFLVLANITGFIIFISYLDADEIVGLWALSWIVYASLAIIYVRFQLKEERALQYEKIQDSGANLKPRRSYACCCVKGVGACIGWLLLFIITIFLILTTFQAVSLAIDARIYPPPGKLFRIEGEKGGSFIMHIYCIGPQPAPNVSTYILEAGGGSSSTAMFQIQSTLAEQYKKRVCVYDRAGYGWSHMGESPRTNEITVKELKQLLGKQGEIPPFLLIGHSAGGQLIQSFAKLYNNEVSGLVLLDSYPDFLNLTGIDFPHNFLFSAPAYNWTEKDINAQMNSILSILDVSRSIGTATGILRFVVNSNDYFPVNKRKENSATYGTLRNWNAQYWDYREFVDNTTDPTTGVTIGNRPVLFISAGTTVNSTCAQAKIEENSQACEIHLKVNSLYYGSALSQAKRLSTNSSVIVCPYPCSHAMVWDENYLFLVQHILSLGL